MSFILAKAAHENSDEQLNIHQKYILHALCMRVNVKRKNSTVFPTINSLAKQIRCSSRTIQRGLKKLEELNYLKIEKQLDKHGYNTANLYHINSEKVHLMMQSRASQCHPMTSKVKNTKENDGNLGYRVTDSHHRVTDSHHNNREYNKQYLPKELNIYQDTIAIDKTDHNFFSCSETDVDNIFDVPEPDSCHLNDYDYDEDGIPIPKVAVASPTEMVPYEAPRLSISGATEISFEEFWSEYPLKTAKKAARKVFDRIAKSGKGFDILTALRAQNYERNLKLKYGMFIPNPCHATTWLNGERWDDVVMTEEAIRVLVPAMAGASKSEITDSRKQAERTEIDAIFSGMSEKIKADFDKELAQKRLGVDNTSYGFEDF